MRTAIAILVVVLVALGVYWLSRSPEMTPEPSTTETPGAAAAIGSVATVTSNAAKSAATPPSKGLVTTPEGTHGVPAVPAALAQITSTNVVEMRQMMAGLEADKTKAEEQVHHLEDKLSSVERDLKTNRSKLGTVEFERTRLTKQLGSVTNQIAGLHQQIDKLNQTNAADETELASLRGRYATLQMEKDSLERQLNDIPFLERQIAAVKRRLWQDHIAAWKRDSERAGENGNHGYLLKNGRWLTVEGRAGVVQ